MQFRIDFGRTERLRVVPALPGIPERIEPLPPALSTRSVPCRKRDGFVQEEKLCIAARCHNGAAPTLKFQKASYPTPAIELAHNLA